LSPAATQIVGLALAAKMGPESEDAMAELDLTVTSLRTVIDDD
jgi:hypothetical protein